MKRLTILLILCYLLLAAWVPLQAQNPDANNLELNIHDLESDLNKLNADLQTYDDIAVYDYSFQEAGNRVRSFAALVSKEDPLYDSYNSCNLLYYQIQKRIDELKADHQRKQDYDALMNRLQNSIADLSSLKEQGDRYVQAKEQDSLLIVKKKASRIYVKATGETESKKQLVDNDPAFQKLMESIEEYNEEIEALECPNKTQFYEMGFRIIMVGMVLVLVLNMLKTKIKAKKLAKEAQKQMNQFMGKDDTPVL